MDLYTGGPPPIPLVACYLPSPWARVLRRARVASPGWQWPDSVAGLVSVLSAPAPVHDAGLQGAVPAAVTAAETAAGRAWERGRSLGLRLALESRPGFPAGLSDAEAWLLWARVADGALDPPRVAVVGSREATPHGLAVAERLAHDLAAAGLTIVSGLARGIDSAAHRGALASGRTLAVFGSGLDCVYPRAHTGLAEAICARGGLLSEFAPGTPPRPGHFPQRNRIIAALSLAVVVVEAGERSGSLSTARWALDLGRDVLVVPSHVLHGRNRGGHALVRDGAELVEDAAQVLAALSADVRASLAPSTGAVPSGEAAPASVGLASCLEDGEVVDVETLTRKTRWSIDRVLRELSALEIDGRVSRVGPGRFVCLYRK